MDTTTVNLIADKFTQAWGQIAPTLGMGFEEYCRYLVFQEGIQALIWGGGCLLLILVSIALVFIGKLNDDEDWVYSGFATFAIVLLIIIPAIAQTYIFVKAYNFPEIYTIEHIIKMAR